jgi:NADP-dependent 3-hydroxy acid dehydrogenase YdfG
VSTDHSYQNKVAVVTGGASGIGAALAKHLARAGARVVIADRQVELAESIATAIRSGGGTAVAVELDVRELAAMTRMVSDTVARWGTVDYFFNNAGIGVGGDAAEYSSTVWNDALDVNLRGVIHGIQAVYPVMIQQGSGHIVNTASIAGLVASAGTTAYAATKHAVVAISKSLRIEAKFYGVRVSVLCPGAIRTPILQGGKFGHMQMDHASLSELDKLWERMRPMPPDELAPKVAAAVLRNQAIIIQPAWWRLVWLFDRLFPALSSKLCELGYENMRNQALAQQSSAAALQPAPASRRSETNRNLS